jgi:hypothetical protein
VKKETCVIKAHLLEVSKKYTGIFAILVNGVVDWYLYEKGGINTDKLIEFLRKNITCKLRHLELVYHVS